MIIVDRQRRKGVPNFQFNRLIFKQLFSSLSKRGLVVEFYWSIEDDFEKTSLSEIKEIFREENQIFFESKSLKISSQIQIGKLWIDMEDPSVRLFFFHQ